MTAVVRARAEPGNSCHPPRAAAPGLGRLVITGKKEPVILCGASSRRRDSQQEAGKALGPSIISLTACPIPRGLAPQFSLLPSHNLSFSSVLGVH